MKIIDIKCFKLTIPLKKPFKTALRSVYEAEETIIKVFTDSDAVGYGEAPPTEVITGETAQSVKGIIERKIKPILIGEDVSNIEKLHSIIEGAAIHNTSAKAAVEMAVYDLYGQLYKAPVYKLLGGYQNSFETDLTISVNSPEEMCRDSIEAISEGYATLKLKVGNDLKLDIERVKAIRTAVGIDTKLRLDANQGWRPKEAVYAIRKFEDLGLDIELIEQPVKARDFEGLKHVTDNVNTLIMADESLFSVNDCFTLLQMRACDLLNIKLMKTGGLYNALTINSMAEMFGVECMLGSMLEAKVSVTAAAHLAAAKKNITRIDLDAASLLAKDPVTGGMVINGPVITLTEDPGFGIKDIEGLEEF